MPDIWLNVDANIVVPMNILPITDDTDFKTTETALVYNSAGLLVYWNFVTSAGAYTCVQIHPTTSGVHDISEPVADIGMYGIEIPATGGDHANNDTEGYGWITGFCTGMLPFRGPIIGLRAEALNDALCDGGDVLDVNLAQILATALTETSAGYLAAAFKKLFDIASPVLTAACVNQAADNNTILASASYGLSALKTLIDALSGATGVSLSKILNTAIPAESVAGRDAAAFGKLLDVATPVLTAASVNQGADNNVLLASGTKGLVKVYDDMAKDSTVSKPATAQTITANQAVNVAQWGGSNIVTPAVTGSPVVTLGGTQAAYAPSKAGDQMDLVNAPNATAVTAIQNGLASASNLATVAGYLDTEIGALTTELAKVPKSDGSVSLNATVIAAIQNGLATAADMTIVKNNVDGNINTGSGLYYIPLSGGAAKTYRIEFFHYASDGGMEAPDAAPTIDVVNQAGTSRNLNLDSTTMALVSTGRYRAVYTVDDSHAVEQLNIVVSCTEGSQAKAYGAEVLTTDEESKIADLYTKMFSSYPELTSVPGKDAGIAEKMAMPFMAMKNGTKTDETASTVAIKNDAGTAFSTATVTETATTTETGKMA